MSATEEPTPAPEPEPQPAPAPQPEPEPDEATDLGDEGLGPDESDEVLNDPENKAAADAIRESTTKEE